MIMILLSLSISTTITFFFLKHPLSMGLTLLIQSTLIALTTGLFNHNVWFSYILFLIMIGGMLVLFIYMTSIASNEMFKYSNSLFMTIMSFLIVTILVFTIMDQFNTNQIMFNMDLNSFNLNESFKMSLNKYLNFPSNIVLFFMIIYLFITLIAVVKITNILYGPMRQKF